MSDEKKTEAQASCACAEETEVVNVRQPKCLFDKITISFYSVVCFVMAILLMVIITAATLMRYIFEMDLYGYEEWVKIFAFWLYFLGAASRAYAGTHLSAYLISSSLKARIFHGPHTFLT